MILTVIRKLIKGGDKMLFVGGLVAGGLLVYSVMK